MDNLRDFFGRFMWKPTNRETSSEVNPKFNALDNSPNASDKKDSQLYNYPSSRLPTRVDDFDNFGFPNRPETPGDDFNPFQHRPSMVFGDVFSMMGQMFRDMERSMNEMNQFFEGGDVFNDPRFGMLDDFNSQNFPNALEDSDEPVSMQKPNPNANLRDLMLKSDAPPNNKDKIDSDLDDLYKNNKLDLSELPLLKDDKSPSKSNQLVPIIPRGNQSSHTRTSSSSSYSYINGKWQMKEKVIKETNEGKEVITRTTNEKGEVDTQTEFIPNNNSGSGGSGGGIVKSYYDRDGDDEFTKMSGLFERLFRPRM